MKTLDTDNIIKLATFTLDTDNIIKLATFH